MRKLLLACLIGTLSLSLFSGCGAKNQLRFGTGNKSGNYYLYGNTIKEIAEKENASFSLQIKETAGSAANLRLMRDGFLDLAIVQSDVLSDAKEGKGIFEENAYTKVQTVSELYTEQCQIVVPQNSPIQSIADLAGKRVSIGESESGVAGIARCILQANGMKESNLQASYLSFSDSADSMAKGELDAFFIISAAPTAAISNLSTKMDIRLLSLDERTISYLLNLYEGYTETNVPSGSYPGVNNDVKTIGVKAVLVADEIDSSIIKELKEITDANPIF